MHGLARDAAFDLEGFDTVLKLPGRRFEGATPRRRKNILTSPYTAMRSPAFNPAQNKGIMAA